jgi:hypothetical protein
LAAICAILRATVLLAWIAHMKVRIMWLIRLTSLIRLTHRSQVAAASYCSGRKPAQIADFLIRVTQMSLAIRHRCNLRGAARDEDAFAKCGDLRLLFGRVFEMAEYNFIYLLHARTRTGVYARA